ncbi:hypothetical protein [Aureimonas pseudogalii]|uniref:Uncharacterized protein n=1 Tax=Aureimonas pseudogalii TaxID=1744844 RepID=A0A7W6MMK0_9HYPH|nr:hypothetical protein [Aureimonas pseudogalii]MBB4000917.1 hypothetical protein [Aureimonas pseudogalii]
MPSIASEQITRPVIVDDAIGFSGKVNLFMVRFNKNRRLAKHSSLRKGFFSDDAHEYQIHLLNGFLDGVF